MGEFELIRKYFAAAPCAQGGDGIALGIGDDCALLALPAGEQLAISTDTLVAGVHFADPCDPFLLGQRSLAVAVSDLAPWAPTPSHLPLHSRHPPSMPTGCDAMPRA